MGTPCAFHTVLHQGLLFAFGFRPGLPGASVDVKRSMCMVFPDYVPDYANTPSRSDRICPSDDVVQDAPSRLVNAEAAAQILSADLSQGIGLGVGIVYHPGDFEGLVVAFRVCVRVRGTPYLSLPSASSGICSALRAGLRAGFPALEHPIHHLLQPLRKARPIQRPGGASLAM